MKRVLQALLIGALVAPGTFAQSAADWPGWRGADRSGTLRATDVPAEWPSTFAKTWTVAVGEGYSSPVTSGGVVYIHSRQDPQEIVTALDARTGAVKWRQSMAAPYTKNSYAVRMGKGPNATPLVAGGRVYALGATGRLSAYDAASGKPLWSKDYSKDVDMSKLFCGTAASPMIANGRLIVQVGSDIRGGLVTALDPATGATVWEWRGAGPGYASPILISPAGVPQLVTLTNQSVLGLDARAGRELWSIPFPDEWHENIVTPVWTGTELVVSGIRQGTRAFRLAEKAGAWSASEIWKNADVTMYMSSPVVGDGLVYGLSAKRKGQFVALDLKTGATRWATEGREGDQAAVLLAPRHVLFMTNTGTLIVANRSAAKFETAKRYELIDGATWTTPVFMNGAMFVRDATNLLRFDPK